MTRLLAAIALALVSIAAGAQTDASAETVHVFEVRDGHVYLDGRHLANAVPPGLDLTGLMTAPLEFSGPILPVLEIDGTAYVLEDERLVPMDESRRPDRGVYILGDAVAAAPEAVVEMAPEAVTPIVEAAYMREVATRNGPLFEQMQREQAAEAEVNDLAARVRALPLGAERARLRAQLRGAISELLAFKHETRDQEIAEAEERLANARRALDARRTYHDDIVDLRLRELVGDE
ncbi:hypothetical protein [Rubrivirga sp. IMCC45206]|uniref:hypothetical protein n=1 Tax=Rubrivirga sp. IMCC45206 TaxID=3391614 RepID=UPI0039902E94